MFGPLDFELSRFHCIYIYIYIYIYICFGLSLHPQSDQGLCCEEEVYMDPGISMEGLGN